MHVYLARERIHNFHQIERPLGSLRQTVLAPGEKQVEQSLPQIAPTFMGLGGGQVLPLRSNVLYKTFMCSEVGLGK